VLTFLRDKSRAPAAIPVGPLNTYMPARCRLHAGTTRDRRRSFWPIWPVEKLRSWA